MRWNAGSMQRILLIIFGYLCGIAAKIIAGKINYVLIVYFFNLFAVSLNLVVYFRNRKIDQQMHRHANTKKVAIKS